MKFTAPIHWWRNLPRRTRIRIIASVLFVFAGTELFWLAPQLLELAIMIDFMGSAFVIAALLAFLQVPLLQIQDFARSVGRSLEKLAPCTSGHVRPWCATFKNLALTFAVYGARNFRGSVAVSAVVLTFGKVWFTIAH